MFSLPYWFSPNSLDFVLVLVVVFGIYIGLAQGLIRQVLTIAAFYFALVLSAQYYPYVGIALANWIGADANARNILALVLVFVILALALSWAMRFIYSQSAMSSPSVIDRLIGAVLGFFWSWAVAGVLLSILGFALSVSWGAWEPTRQAIETDLVRSALAPIFDSALPIIFSSLRPWLPLGLPVPFAVP